MVELLFREQLIIDRMRLQNALTRYTGQVRLAVKQVNDQRSSQNKTDEAATEIGKSEPSEQNLDMLVFYHMDHPVSFEEGNIPAQTCMLPVNEIKDRSLRWSSAASMALAGSRRCRQVSAVFNPAS